MHVLKCSSLESINYQACRLRRLHALCSFLGCGACLLPSNQRGRLIFVRSIAQVTHHHHKVEEDWWFDALNGAVPKDDIVHEHDGFRQEMHDMETYLISCLPAGTKWGPYTDVVPAASSQTFDAQRLEKIIEALVAAFVDHVSYAFVATGIVILNATLKCTIVLCRARILVRGHNSR